MLLGRCNIESFVPELATDSMVMEAFDAVKWDNTFLVAAIVI